ncbi:MAG: ATP-dependent DNA helicase RecG [Gammaproteobacteria bacterium]|nr:ATP-dependent DNA helicase RecG [Gammaproteobacteria bacterium]
MSKDTQTTQSSYVQKLLAKLGLHRDFDFALHLPLRYEDHTKMSSLAHALDQQKIQFIAKVIDQQIIQKPKKQLLIRIQDGQEICHLKFFSSYPNLEKLLRVGQVLLFRGEVQFGHYGWNMVHPTVLDKDTPLPTTLTPIYPSTANLSQSYLRKCIFLALTRLSHLPNLPAHLDPHLPKLLDALKLVHYPHSEIEAQRILEKSHPAYHRLVFEELLAEQIVVWQTKLQRLKISAPVIKKIESQSSCLAYLLQTIPFQLTASQQEVFAEIAKDLSNPYQMLRLLQGDVGCGKTIVAALIAALTIDNGLQCVMMVPTEILAHQHLDKLKVWLEPALKLYGKSIAWLIGKQSKKNKTLALEAIHNGEASLVIGTHALLSENVQFSNLGLVIIDEQQRFGVEQRLTLNQLSWSTASGEQMYPHTLMMTATPIPRTLAMCYFADIDISSIRELPPGRQPVTTRLFKTHQRQTLIHLIKDLIVTTRQQVYWVCPLIEESEKLDLVHVNEIYAQMSQALNLSTEVQISVGLLHARLPSEEKNRTMLEFIAGRIDLLVCTTVIEVGVDVPNASIMVIENAERFGLSQLHQLRGRVGRGHQKATCVLLYDLGDKAFLSSPAKQRLQTMLNCHDGFQIAQKDLEIRGPGEILGAKQSGRQTTRFADIRLHPSELTKAQQAAADIIHHDPNLAQQIKELWFGQAHYWKA